MIGKSIPLVPVLTFGNNSIAQLQSIMAKKRAQSEDGFIVFIDDFFKNNTSFIHSLQLTDKEMLIFIDTTEEPTTKKVDAFTQHIKSSNSAPIGIIGIGGGTVLDYCKAVSVMLTNPGKSMDYQGWDLPKNASLFHIGIPTISGTGAEASRTAVLSGPDKKLGINSDYSTFSQVILDPSLTLSVPKNQWFYTGMDCFIHCVESINGNFNNTYSASYAEKALTLCSNVFLGEVSKEKKAEDLMIASWMGGLSIAYSQVGVAHALSYGLSYVLGVKHGIGNCIVFKQLEAFYPSHYLLFRKMLDENEIDLPKSICANLSENEFDQMINMAFKLEPLWEHAIGKAWRDQINYTKLRSLYEKM